MKIGAEPKKIGILIALLGTAGVVFWMNSGSSDTPSAPKPTAAVAAAPVAAPVTYTPEPGTAAKKRQPQGRPSIVENVYKLIPVADPSKVDPTLRMDLLAKVQSIDPEAGARNIFQPGAPPPPPVQASKVLPKVAPIHPNALPPAVKASAAPPQPGAPTPAAPINLKYYGYSVNTADGEKKAFFLDGEDIIVASEGQIIKKQYKIVRITNTSVQMEDTTSKTAQTLAIQPEAAPV